VPLNAWDCQALKSVLPIEDSFSKKETHTFSHIRVHLFTSPSSANARRRKWTPICTHRTITHQLVWQAGAQAALHFGGGQLSWSFIRWRHRAYL